MQYATTDPRVTPTHQDGGESEEDPRYEGVIAQARAYAHNPMLATYRTEEGSFGEMDMNREPVDALDARAPTDNENAGEKVHYAEGGNGCIYPPQAVVGDVGNIWTMNLIVVVIKLLPRYL